MNEEIKITASWLGLGSIDIFGRPFSGKDTQGQILADIFNGELIAGGDILRSHHDPEKIKQILAEGGIIPSDFYLDLILPYLSKPDFKDKPLILSSVGRSQGEEVTVMSATAGSGHPMKIVISLDLAESVVWQRFEAAKVRQDRGNRTDDQRDVLTNRLKEFQEKTVPVIEFYRDKGLLLEVDGTLSRLEVTSEILKSLYKLATHVAGHSSGKS
jgi:adenylate kinase